ncbi:uncharacterized protein LOC142620244 [Castanea sativa]|uniref:uncharacterized protein LOC142620244 n=1 Tax=Castanea sativa TaxID=21020 RepID=UPI003F6534CE
MEAATPSSASYAWKSIIKGREVIKKCAVWRIGRGESVHVWGDNWLPGTEMNRVVSPCWRGTEDFTVSLFIDQINCKWKEDLLDYYLMDFEAEKIKAIPLSKTQLHDTLIWPHNPNGDYTMKSGYKILQKEFQSQQPGTSNPEASKSLWQAIWKLNVPSKVKNLMWRACRDSLPTKTNLARDRLYEFSNLHNPISASAATPATCWRPPDQGFFKINFDGALFSKENRAGIGVVVRNEEGLVLASLSQQILLPTTVMEVETLAARHALEFAVEIGVHSVILKGDSTILINALQSNNHSLAHFGHLAEDVKYLASCFPRCMFSHVRRHCNKVAHSLARRALTYPHLLVWMEDVPPDVFDVFQADLKGLH